MIMLRHLCNVHQTKKSQSPSTPFISNFYKTWKSCCSFHMQPVWGQNQLLCKNAHCVQPSTHRDQQHKIPYWKGAQGRKWLQGFMLELASLAFMARTASKSTGEPTPTRIRVCELLRIEFNSHGFRHLQNKSLRSVFRCSQRTIVIQPYVAVKRLRS